MKIINILLIIIYILRNYSKCSDLNIQLLNNGGVRINNKSICPLSYGEGIDSDCSTVSNTSEICNQAFVPHLGNVGNICCWSKYRNQINLYELKETTGNNEHKSDNDKVVGIFETYGPYFERDIQYVNSLLSRDSYKNELVMKYGDFFSKNINNNQIQIEGGQSLGFVILIHSIDMGAIKNIFKILYQPYHYFVIHIDKKYTDVDKIEMLNQFILELQANHKSIKSSKYKNYPSNIRITDNRFSGEWGEISLVYMEVAAYTVLLDMVHERSEATNKPSLFSHMINLSSNDMLIRSLKNISKTLFEGNNINTTYIHCCIADVNYRYNKLYQNNYGISKNIINQYDCGLDHVVSNNDILDGSQWHYLTSKFIHYIITSPKSLEKLFSLKFSSIPDESFFQNIHHLYKETYNLPYERNTHRHTLWTKNRYEVTLNDLDKLHEDAYIIRKVYNNTVRNEMIKRFNLLE